MTYIVSFVVVVGVIILVHELGHFLAARAVGIRVDRFSIGFGPKLAAVQRGETEYRLSWIPLGGYVKMAGMIDESLENPDDFDPNDTRLFMNRKVWQKVLTVCAGVMMNMILAALVLWVVYATRGVPTLPDQVPTVIDRPVSGYPAAKAELKRGDKILAVDGNEVALWEDLVQQIYDRPGREIRIDFERAGERKSIVLTTRSDAQPGKDKPIGKIGITPLPNFERLGIAKAFGYGCVMTWTILDRTARSIWMLIVGQASIKDLAGPVGIARMTGETARQGMGDLFELLALISVNIGFLNILPIPALDGGHLVMVLVEGVRRRPLSTKFKMWAQQVGMILLLALIVVVVFNDFLKLR
jgi:regulator of sigma E protease